LANPPALVDLMIGQTGFLTTGIYLFGLTLLPSSPFAAGAILGLLLIKPQLALLLPGSNVGRSRMARDRRLLLHCSADGGIGFVRHRRVSRLP
jgi:hypothetical protein